MKARLPEEYKPRNQQELIKQARKMQEDVAALQEELDAREYTASAGGDMVTVTVTGKHQVTAIKIKPELIEEAKDDPEMLEDLIITAVNSAVTTATQTADEEMEKVTGALNIPGFPGLS